MAVARRALYPRRPRRGTHGTVSPALRPAHTERAEAREHGVWF